MRKALFILLLTAYSLVSKGQEPFLSFDHYLGEGAKRPTQLFSTFIPENDSFLVFVEDKKQLHAYEFDAIGQERSAGFSFPNIAKKYPNIAGYTIKNNHYYLYLSNASKKKWAVAKIDFSKKSFEFTETKLEITGDRLLESISYNNKHFVFTIVHDTSTIQVYELNTEGKVTSKLYSFEDIDFGKGKASINNLDRLVQSNFSRQANVIDKNAPLSLESSKHRIKIYQNENLVTLTIDSSNKQTYFLEFDMDTKTTSSKILDKTSLEKEIYKTKSNSFLYEDKLFVIKCSSHAMDFSIYEANTLKKLTSYNANQDDPITFKNTPIIQDGGSLNSYRELEKTTKFLRKISSSNPAIAVSSSDNQYIITLGATKEVSSSGAAIIPLAGGLGGAIATGLISGLANATLNQYSAYSHTLSTHFKVVLDQDYQFVRDAEIPLNAFDHIKEFTQETPPSVLQTVCKVSDNYVWGALNRKNNKINFFSF